MHKLSIILGAVVVFGAFLAPNVGTSIILGFIGAVFVIYGLTGGRP